ncbi:hypothetical protein BDV32DRAFT_146236 [Aspergillus pseudonomiae]|uniref:Uncharacterized protein n=1 Tax=Aspergillus pseudonomiae TaxID=1506151 RepID=A0A5N6IFT4_9EURO|nr:uncharacterized protein BDV37DRAFT_284127 [Aspergillus pseudonomiae]KAB8263933.1 hypothetical protein BDV32DRAFT_146236 [Aspergillus pseudonomiae]KAE8402974.1 hypothetical protein BDV37DRAFT_284127 [Aspergillus pseudonomiae]
MPPTKHLPNGTYPYNHNNRRNSTSTSSFTTSISTNSLTSKLDTNINHHSNTNNNTLTRHPTLTSLTRWVSRKMSRPRLRNHAGELNEGRSLSEDEEDGRTTEDDYAAWCWAFSEGRTGGTSPGNFQGGTYSHGYEYDHEYGYASYGEHGHGHDHGQKYDENLLFSDFNEQNPPNGGPHSRKYEAHGHDHTYADLGGEQGTTNTRGTYTFLQNPEDRLGRYESSDSVPADQLVRFTPIGHYGYSPLTAGRPVSPPRRILTPARYAETNRMEREKSDELKQKQRGFWGPVRALWVSLRRSR